MWEMVHTFSPLVANYVSRSILKTLLASLAFEPETMLDTE